MYRLAIYLGGDFDEVVELQDRIAGVLRGRRMSGDAAGYAIALAEVPEPEDDDAFIALVTEDARRVLLGPPELLRGA